MLTASEKKGDFIHVINPGLRWELPLAGRQFGRVILDYPPLMSVSDAVILATQAEGVILVVQAETAPRRVAQEARDRLLEVKAPPPG